MKTPRTHATLRVSIVGGAIASDLLAATEKRPDRRAFREAFGGAVSFELTRSYRGDTPTGSLRLLLRQISANPCGGFGFRREYRIRPEYSENARRLINRRATLWLREWSNERIRQEAVQRLDDAAKPHTENPEFMAWVEVQENAVGVSSYNTLPTEQANAWTEAVRAWSVSPGSAYVQKIIEA
jgi:hypothetical protein